MSKISKNERAWVEINLESIKKNYFEIKKFAKKNICAIIKAEDSAAGHENHLSIDVMLPLSLHPIHLR